MKKIVSVVATVLMILAVSVPAYSHDRKKLRINEVMVANENSIVDDYGQRHGWIELFNSNFAPLEISSIFLSNDSTNPKKYPVPIGDVNTEIATRQHVVFFLDGEPNKGTFHTNFVLVPGEENWLGIYDADGTLIDAVTVPAEIGTDQSYARTEDGSGEWAIRYGNENDYITPSSANIIKDTNKKIDEFREKDENGKYYRTLSLQNVAPSDMSLGINDFQLSPVYEAKYLSSFTTSENLDFYNNLGINWELISGLRLKGNFKISNETNRTDAYLSPMSYYYIKDNDNTVNEPDVLFSRGQYNLSNSSGLVLSGNVIISYTLSRNKHLFQGIIGGELKQQDNRSDSYAVTGFMNDALTHLSYAVQFKQYSRPAGTENTIRSAGAFSNLNYSFDNRYLLDLTGRLDGSSLFGRNQPTTPFWSVGIRWNISREKFMENQNFIQNLAVRASIGTIGNQNFTLNQAMSLYSWLGPTYGPFSGASIISLGNPNLKCQETLNRNIGIEFNLLKGSINLDLNYYNNITKGNLTDISIAPSIGFETYKTNMGDLTNNGIDFSLTITPVRTKDWMLTLNLNGSHNTNKIKRISEALKKYNDMVGKKAEKENVNVFLFEEGQSMNTIYAVRSLGIDPGTGKEIFLTKNGEQTFTWNPDEQIPVGCKEADLEGYFGFNLKYRSWDLGSSFHYSTGADKYNYTLHEKIEGVNNMKNNDRRALTERWKRPGDVARYKSIKDTSPTRSTSRFVQKEHMLSLNSLRLSYTLPTEKLKQNFISMLRLSATMNDLFYISTIRQERGLSYPFARTIHFAAQINF